MQFEQFVFKISSNFILSASIKYLKFETRQKIDKLLCIVKNDLLEEIKEIINLADDAVLKI